ncbi:hypothetical protein ACN20G_30955 (plasmid) [Streptomyces sp. BI20]|uniref:hypothetical protein n=1 Tax=Streptomyces sp. BI20 TaxID=3403460 RepID=UPI003C70BED7
MPPIVELDDLDALIEDLGTQVAELDLPEAPENAQTLSVVFCTYTQCLTKDCG